jgi:hypothetical protein
VFARVRAGGLLLEPGICVESIAGAARSDIGLQTRRQTHPG